MVVLASIALIACAGPPAAPPIVQTWSFQTLVSFKGNVSQVAAARVGTFHDIAGISWFDLDAKVFGGFNISQDNKLTGGGVLSKRFRLAREAQADIGGYAQGTLNGKLTGGLYIGLTITFGG